MTGGFPVEVVTLVFDIAVSILLVITIIYAAILNKKLNILRESKQEMEGLLGRFADTAKEAEAGLAGLRESAAAAGETLQGRIERGTVLADDLVFLVERATALADRLEGGAPGGGKAAGTPARSAESDRGPDPEPRAPSLDRRQAALMEQLKSVR